MTVAIKVPNYNVKKFKPYQLGIELTVLIDSKISQLPVNEKHNISDQIIRSSDSIVEAIALGGENDTLQSRASEYSRAIGTANETATWSLIARELGFWDRETEEIITKKVRHINGILTKVLFGMIDDYGKVEGINNACTPNVRDMIAFKKGILLMKSTYSVLDTEEGLADYLYSLKIKKAVCSILANLAESNVPYYKIKQVRLMNVKQAVVKVQNILDSMLRKKQINEIKYLELYSLSEEIHKITNKIYSKTPVA